MQFLPSMPNVMGHFQPLASQWNGIAPNQMVGHQFNHLGASYFPQLSKKAKILRRGKWNPEEERYAAAIIDAFKKGVMDNVDEGETLRTVLASLLQCAPMRISKKYPGSMVGKMTFVTRSCPKEEVEAIHADLEKLNAEWKKSMQAIEPKPMSNATAMSESGTAHMTPLAPATSTQLPTGVGNCPPMMAVFVPFRATDPTGMQFVGMPPGMQAMPTTNVIIQGSPASLPTAMATTVTGPSAASRKRSRPRDTTKEEDKEEGFNLDMFKEFPEFHDEPPKRSRASSAGTTATLVGGDEPEALEISDSGSDVNDDHSIEQSLLALFPGEHSEENCHFDDDDALPLDDAYWLEVE